ncbi:MAG: phosphopyruvate hydratase [Alphaproteobacteria bacterium]|nr:phosphopyruvate hydratase [Alphaproteobacteria bacterium]
MTSTRIARIHGRRVWDSRGRPTVEAEVELAGGAIGRAIAPAGASTGSGEAVDLRDGGASQGGLDVTRAVANVEGDIASLLQGMDAADQAAVDAELVALDGTPTKRRLGGNATIAVSMAVAHAAAAQRGLPLWRHLGGERPRVALPEIQVIGGGAHAAARVDLQDFLVIATGASSVAQALDWTGDVYRAAGAILKERGLLQGVADEGGWWPAFDSNEAALETLYRAIEKAGFEPGREMSISLDIAATQLHDKGSYRLRRDDRTMDAAALGAMLARWADDYRIVAIEDPVAETDAEGMVAFTHAVGARCLVVGDDFLVTNAARIRAAAAAGACNTALIKPNQAGTLTETKAAFDAARAAGWRTIVSARSGETEDCTIVHLAAAWGADLLKVGSFARGERTAKWNESLRLAEVEGAGFTRWKPIGG